MLTGEHRKMVKFRETEKDIVYMAGYMMAKGEIEIGDSREFLIDVVPQWATEFESLEGTGWDTEDYMEAVECYAIRKLNEAYGVDKVEQ